MCPAIIFYYYFLGKNKSMYLIVRTYNLYINFFVVGLLNILTTLSCNRMEYIPTMKKILTLQLLVWSLQLVNCQSDDDVSGMSFIGLALEAFSPCPDGFISMEREIGRRPSEENYWSGYFNLKKYKNLPEARIFLKLDNPATFKIVSFK